MTPESLSGRVMRAGLWVVGARMGGRLLAAAGTLVLARLLTPHDFGLVALALVPLPGHPAIVVDNMPGAGGLVAANHLYDPVRLGRARVDLTGPSSRA